MENQQKNPLAGHFRQPAIYLTLPSKGRWWGENALNMPANREIPIYPMSTKDEIILRTPDALLNGQGIIEVIHSCCPNITDAWQMPSIDVDAVLIAIRIATYGNDMNFDSKCTHCGEDNTHGVDLSEPLASLRCPNYAEPLEHKGLKIKFKPQHYFTANKSNILEFQEQKILNLLAAADMDPEDKAVQIKQAMDKLFDQGLRACTDCTDYIEMEDGQQVHNTDYIFEFYTNAESGLIREIQAKVQEFSNQAKPNGIALACQECHKPYEVELAFDYANFFGRGF
jgi:hypothetical protein